MKPIEKLLKFFDKQLIELTIINSVVFAILLYSVFDMTFLKALILAPFAFLGFVLALIVASHILSAIMGIFDKNHKSK
jgi:predicted membrane protein